MRGWAPPERQTRRWRSDRRRHAGFAPGVTDVTGGHNCGRIIGTGSACAKKCRKSRKLPLSGRFSQQGLRWVRKSAYNCRLSPICALRPSVSPGALATVSSGNFPWQTPHKHASAHAKPSFKTLTTRHCARVCAPLSRPSARPWLVATRQLQLLHSRPLKARSTASLTRRSSTRTRLHVPSRVCPLPSRQWLPPKFG